MKDSRKPIRIASDALILGTMVLLANFLLGRDDAGWRWLNPTPYILVPALLGGRYGFSAGLAGGALADMLMLGAALSFGDGNTSDFIASRSYTFIGLPIAGIVAGEIHRFLHDKRNDLHHRNAVLKEQAESLARQLEVSRDTQHSLQRQLSLHGAEFCSLDLELRRLFQPDAGPLLPGALNLLSHFTGITDAAIYRVGTPLILEARIGDATVFPERLAPGDAAIARAALESGELATARGLWESTPDLGHRFLAALPLKGREARVLLIHRMPFLSVNWHTFAQLEMICQWITLMEESSGADNPGDEYFARTVDLALATAAGNGLPSAILIVAAAVLGNLPSAELKSLVQPSLEGGEILRTAETPEPHLTILLPLAGKRECDALAERITIAAAAKGAEIRLRHLAVNADTDRHDIAIL